LCWRNHTGADSAEWSRRWPGLLKMLSLLGVLMLGMVLQTTCQRHNSLQLRLVLL
jgi:hypothetical protein